MDNMPLRDVTEEEIEAYWKDGTVCLRNILSLEWIDRTILLRDLHVAP